jgi:hypothetical protein
MSTAQRKAQNISTEIAHREPASAGSLMVQGPIGTDDWRTLAQIANTIGNTEFVPKGLRGNKPAIMACLLYGRDQGIPAMIALTEIAVVDGRPTMSANLMASKARANGHRISRAEHRNPDGEVVAVTAKGVHRDGTTDEITWTLDDAKRAGLLAKQNWVKYPRQMLWARAVSELCRTLFNDAFLGSVYTVDEIGDTLDKHDDLDAEYAEVSAPSPATPPDGAGSGGSDEGAEVDGAAGVADVSSAATGDVVFDTGKHKGETVAEVAAADPAFLWAAVNYKSGPVKDAIADWLLEHPDTPKVSEPPVDGEQQEVAT